MTLATSTKTSPDTPVDVERLSDLHGRLYELIHGELVEKIVSFKANIMSGQIITRFNNAYRDWRPYVAMRVGNVFPPATPRTPATLQP